MGYIWSDGKTGHKNKMFNYFFAIIVQQLDSEWLLNNYLKYLGSITVVSPISNFLTPELKKKKNYSASHVGQIAAFCLSRWVFGCNVD